jgi:outer membrane protein OmpA-like peptidoglycan-associated protein
MVLNDRASYGDDLSIAQSRRLETYFDNCHLVGTIYFPFDNYSHILNSDKEAILANATILAGKNRELIVVGYADTVGTKNYNIDLSVRRAKTVKKALVKYNGVDADSVDVVAFGESKVSKEFGRTTFEDSANRRVEIYAVKKQTECGSGY